MAALGGLVRISVVFQEAQGEVKINKILLAIITVLIPPLAVFLNNGAGKDLVINIVLCLFFYVPGILHALWLVFK